MSDNDESCELRSKLDYPAVDGDGHLIVSMALLFRYPAKVGGSR